MRRRPRAAVPVVLSCVSAALCAGSVWAQAVPARAAAAPASAAVTPVAAAASAAPAAAGGPGRAATQRTVIEDDNARIDELRVRGQLQRVTVQSKLGNVAPYEVQVGPGGRDPSARERGGAGQSAWRLFSF